MIKLRSDTMEMSYMSEDSSRLSVNPNPLLPANPNPLLNANPNPDFIKT